MTIKVLKRARDGLPPEEEAAELKSKAQITEKLWDFVQRHPDVLEKRPSCRGGCRLHIGGNCLM